MTIAGRSLKPHHVPSTTLLAGVALLLILFVTTAWFFVLPETGRSPEMLALGERNEAMLAEWSARRPGEYRYVVERNCDCSSDYTRPYSVSYVGGIHTVGWFRSMREESGLAAPPDAVLVEDLFALIRRASAEADALEVSYSARFAHPTRVVIDWSAEAADDEQRFDVRDFEVLQYN